MKKTLLALVAFTTILMVGCKEKNGQNEPNPPIQQLRPQDMIGRGYDATQQYCKEAYVASAVLDLDLMASAGLIADIVSPLEANDFISYGSSLTEYHENLTNQLGISGKLYGFTASIQNNFAITSSSSIENSYYTARKCYKKYIYKMKASPISDLLPCLTKEFQADVERLSAEDLIKRYGTHVICGISTGGVIEYHAAASCTETESKEDVKLALEFGYKGLFNISAKEQLEKQQTFKNKHSEFQEKMICRGGDSYLLITSKDSPLLSGLEQWSASLTDESKTVLVDFEGSSGEDGKLIPLYKFITDPQKSATVEKLINQRLANPWKDTDTRILSVFLKKIVCNYPGATANAWIEFNLEVSDPTYKCTLFNTYATDANTPGGGLKNNCLHFYSSDATHIRVLDFTDPRTKENMYWTTDYFHWGEPKTIPFILSDKEEGEITLHWSQVARGFAKSDYQIVLYKQRGSSNWYYMDGSDLHVVVDRNKAEKDDSNRYIKQRIYLKSETNYWFDFYLEIEYFSLNED